MLCNSNKQKREKQENQFISDKTMKKIKKMKKPKDNIEKMELYNTRKQKKIGTKEKSLCTHDIHYK